MRALLIVLKEIFTLIKKGGILIAIGILSFSCKPYTSTTSNSNAMTYSQFRTQQHSFQSSEGAIKYIDQGQGDVIVLLHGVPT